MSLFEKIHVQKQCTTVLLMFSTQHLEHCSVKPADFIISVAADSEKMDLNAAFLLYSVRFFAVF